jgi:hypothetical protein
MQKKASDLAQQLHRTVEREPTLLAQVLLQKIVIRKLASVRVQLLVSQTKPLRRRHLGLGACHVDQLGAFCKKRYDEQTKKRQTLEMSAPWRQVILPKKRVKHPPAFDSCEALISGPTSFLSFLNMSDTGEDVEIVLRAARLLSCFTFDQVRAVRNKKTDRKEKKKYMIKKPNANKIQDGTRRIVTSIVTRISRLGYSQERAEEKSFNMPTFLSLIAPQ